MFKTAFIALALSLALAACVQQPQNPPLAEAGNNLDRSQSPRHVPDTHAAAPWHVPVVTGARPPVWPDDKTSEQPP
jgi:hypothetical protein